MSSMTKFHMLKVGDRVVDFRGEKVGTVVAIETGRYPKSDRVTVALDLGGMAYNYETVWSHLG